MCKNSKEQQSEIKHSMVNSECCNKKENIYKGSIEVYKDICDMYEKDDNENFLTSRGNRFVEFLKKVGIAVLIGYAIISIHSMKKTLDNISDTVHNASSVKTK